MSKINFEEIKLDWAEKRKKLELELQDAMLQDEKKTELEHNLYLIDLCIAQIELEEGEMLKTTSQK